MDEVIPIEIETAPDHRKEKRRALLLMLAVMTLAGSASTSIAAIGNVVMPLFGFLLLILATTWIYYDSVDRGAPIGTGMRLAILLVAFVGVPVYIFRSRGFTGGVVLALKGLLYLLLLLCIYATINLILHLLSSN
jgi:hypothetical protein